VIQKISRPGSGFRGVLNYVLAEKKVPELVASNMEGQDARELAHEFRDAREANPAVGKPVFHGSLAAAPRDQVSAEQWRQIVETYVERMGYKDSLWVAIRHRDTDHDHVHIVASRVAFDGSRVPDFQEKRRGEEVLRDLEREHGLTRVAPSREAARTAVRRDELASFVRTGEVSVKTRLQEHVDVATRQTRTMGELAHHLAAQGVRMRPNIASTGRVAGVAFELDGVTVKGSDLGRAYSWSGLQQRKGVSYDAERDLPLMREAYVLALRKRADRSAERPAGPLPPLNKAVPTYRAAAVVATRLELQDREARLQRESYDLGRHLGSARQTVDEHARTSSWADSRWHDITRRLEGIYVSPAAAAERLDVLVRTRGYEHAAQVLERRPGELGPLRGIGLAGIQSAARQDALRGATYLARDLRDLGALRSRLVADQPRLAAAARVFSATEPRADAVSEALRWLPGTREIHRDLVRAAHALGDRLLGRLVSQAGLLLIHRAVSVVRSLTRDDQGRGLER
jgi:hypothetical protein